MAETSKSSSKGLDKDDILKTLQSKGVTRFVLVTENMELITTLDLLQTAQVLKQASTSVTVEILKTLV